MILSTNNSHSFNCIKRHHHHTLSSQLLLLLLLLLLLPFRFLVLRQQRFQFLSLINHVVQLQFSPSNRTAHIVGDLPTTHLRVQYIRSRSDNSPGKERSIILGIVANRNGQQRECREILQLDSTDPTIHFHIPSNAFFVFFA